MKFLIVFLALSSVAVVTHGQSLSTMIKMAGYANRLSKIPGVGNVMGSVMKNSPGLITTVMESEQNQNIIVRILGRVAKFMGKMVIRMLLAMDNIINAMQKTGGNILGFILELPSAIFNAARMNYYVLHDSMDRHGITLKAMIRTLEYAFFGKNPVTVPTYSAGYAMSGVTPQLGQGMSTTPIVEQITVSG